MKKDKMKQVHQLIKIWKERFGIHEFEIWMAAEKCNYYIFEGSEYVGLALLPSDSIDEWVAYSDEDLDWVQKHYLQKGLYFTDENGCETEYPIFGSNSMEEAANKIIKNYLKVVYSEAL